MLVRHAVDHDDARAVVEGVLHSSLVARRRVGWPQLDALVAQPVGVLIAAVLGVDLPNVATLHLLNAAREQQRRQRLAALGVARDADCEREVARLRYFVRELAHRRFSVSMIPPSRCTLNDSASIRLLGLYPSDSENANPTANAVRMTSAASSTTVVLTPTPRARCMIALTSSAHSSTQRSV